MLKVRPKRGRNLSKMLGRGGYLKSRGSDDDVKVLIYLSKKKKRRKKERFSPKEQREHHLRWSAREKGRLCDDPEPKFEKRGRKKKCSLIEKGGKGRYRRRSVRELSC